MHLLPGHKLSQGDTFDARIGGIQANRMQRQQQAPSGGATPEPIGKCVTAGAARLRRRGLHIKAFHIFRSTAKSLPQAELRRWTVGGTIVDQQDMEKPRRCFNVHSGRPNSRAAPCLGGKFLPWCEARNLRQNTGKQRRDIRCLRRRQGDGTSPPGHVYLGTAGRLIGKIIEDWWAVLTLEQGQGGAQDLCLEFRFIRRPEWTAKFKRHPKEAWRPQAFGVVTYQADSRRRHAFVFNVVGQRAHGAGAVGSDRDKQGGVNPVLL